MLYVVIKLKMMVETLQPLDTTVVVLPTERRHGERHLERRISGRQRCFVSANGLDVTAVVAVELAGLLAACHWGEAVTDLARDDPPPVVLVLLHCATQSLGLAGWSVGDST